MNQKGATSTSDHLSPNVREINGVRINSKGSARGVHGLGKRSTVGKGFGPLFELRARLDWTQEQMAERLGCKPLTISRCERAGTIPGGGVGAKFVALLQETR